MRREDRSANGRRTRLRSAPPNGWRAPADANGNGVRPPERDSNEPVPPSWLGFVRYCQELGYGKIERLEIQDGLPVLAEVTTQKIKFR